MTASAPLLCEACTCAEQQVKRGLEGLLARDNTSANDLAGNAALGGEATQAPHSSSELLRPHRFEAVVRFVTIPTATLNSVGLVASGDPCIHVPLTSPFRT